MATGGAATGRRSALPRLPLPVLATAAMILAWLAASGAAIVWMRFPTTGAWILAGFGWVALLPLTLGASHVARALDHTGDVGATARFQAVAIPLLLAVLIPLAATRWAPGVAQAPLAVPPGAGRVVFASTLTGNSEIVLYDPAAGGDHLVTLTHDPAADREPAISPDGSGVLFVSDRSGSDDLYLLEIATHRLIRITRLAGSERTPAWSPDGRSIAFASDHDGDYDIWIARADGSAMRDLTDANRHGDAAPEWSPDGTSIAASDESRTVWDIRVWPLDGGHPRDITRAFDGFAWGPHWSPDGRTIAFSGTSSSDEPPDVFTIAADGSGLRRLTDDPSRDWAMGWFAGDRVWMISDRPGNGDIWGYWLPVTGGTPTLFVRS